MADLLLALRKRGEAERLRKRQRATAEAAREGARELCEAVGPDAIAAEYGSPGASEHETAATFARAAYNPEVFTAAYKGAREGFDAHTARSMGSSASG